MTRRFYVAEPVRSPTVILKGDEARHLATVLRAAPGMEVTLFDGSGDEFGARVLAARRDRVELEVLVRRSPQREASPPITLAVALPKGDRQRWLVEKAVELGVARLVPLVCDRGVARPTPNALARLKRTVIEASKQCGRNCLMDVSPPHEAAEWLAAAPADAQRWLAHPGGNPPGRLLAAPTSPAVAAVGPEGGFTDRETQAADRAGWRRVDLGPRTLRVETAAIALATLLVLGRRP